MDKSDSVPSNIENKMLDFSNALITPDTWNSDAMRDLVGVPARKGVKRSRVDKNDPEMSRKGLVFRELKLHLGRDM